jgi:hypothetical protein
MKESDIMGIIETTTAATPDAAPAKKAAKSKA